VSRLQAALKARALSWLARREYSRAELLAKLRQAAHLLAATPEPQKTGASGAASGAAGGAANGVDTTADCDAHPEADTETAVQAVLEWLTQQGHASEQRFVESCLHRRASRWGGRRIEMELAQHGLSLNPEQEVALREGEFERAWAVWQRKFGGRGAGRTGCLGRPGHKGHSAPAQPWGDALDALGTSEGAPSGRPSPTSNPLEALKAKAQQARFLSARGFSPDTIRAVLRRGMECDDDEA
jgi:regulatory protein